MLLCVVAYLLTLPCTYSHMMIIRFLPRSHHYPPRTCCCWKSIDKWSLNEGTKTREFFPTRGVEMIFEGICVCSTSRASSCMQLSSSEHFSSSSSLLFAVDWSLIWAHIAPALTLHTHRRSFPFSRWSTVDFFPPFHTLDIIIISHSPRRCPLWNWIFFTFSAYYCFTGLPDPVLSWPVTQSLI